MVLSIKCRDWLLIIDITITKSQQRRIRLKKINTIVRGNTDMAGKTFLTINHAQMQNRVCRTMELSPTPRWSLDKAQISTRAACADIELHLSLLLIASFHRPLFDGKVIIPDPLFRLAVCHTWDQCACTHNMPLRSLHVWPAGSRQPLPRHTYSSKRNERQCNSVMNIDTRNTKNTHLVSPRSSNWRILLNSSSLLLFFAKNLRVCI